MKGWEKSTGTSVTRTATPVERARAWASWRVRRRRPNSIEKAMRQIQQMSVSETSLTGIARRGKKGLPQNAYRRRGGKCD